jgi:hypothetical protein
MGSGPPPTGGNPRPVATSRKSGRGIGSRRGRGTARRRAVRGSASGRHGGTSGCSGGTPQPSRKRKWGFSNLR